MSHLRHTEHRQFTFYKLQVSSDLYESCIPNSGCVTQNFCYPLVTSPLIFIDKYVIQLTLYQPF
jgi:hypothetical protein